MDTKQIICQQQEYIMLLKTNQELVSELDRLKQENKEIREQWYQVSLYNRFKQKPSTVRERIIESAELMVAHGDTPSWTLLRKYGYGPQHINYLIEQRPDLIAKKRKC